MSLHDCEDFSLSPLIHALVSGFLDGLKAKRMLGFFDRLNQGRFAPALIF